MLVAQQLTIPEQLAQAGASLDHVYGPSSGNYGAPLTIDRVIADATVVVHGIIGTGRVYLSDDQREILTDYSLNSATILYDAAVTAVKTPGATPTITVTTLGGAMTFGGFTYRSIHEEMPSLEPGADCLLLLRRIGGQYRLALTFYGAFKIQDSKLVPMASNVKTLANEYAEMSSADAMNDILRRVRAVHR